MVLKNPKIRHLAFGVSVLSLLAGCGAPSAATSANTSPTASADNGTLTERLS